MNEISSAPSRPYVIYDRATGEIISSGVNKVVCVEMMADGVGLGVLYDVHAVPLMHEVDVSDPDAPRLKERVSDG